MIRPSEEEIRIRAYQKWESRIQNGVGYDDKNSDWLTAEQELNAEYSTLKGQFQALIRRAGKFGSKREILPLLPISKYEKCDLFLSSASVIVSFSSVLVTILGFSFAISSLKEQSKTLSSSAHSSLMKKQLEVNKLFIEDPSLNPYFGDGKKVERTDCTNKKCDFNKIEATADYILDFFDIYWSQIQYVEDKDLVAWTNYLQDSFTKSPILCKRMNELQNWYDYHYVNFAKANCQFKKVYLKEQSTLNRDDWTIQAELVVELNEPVAQLKEELEDYRVILFAKDVNNDNWINQAKLLDLSSGNQVSGNSISLPIKIKINSKKRVFRDGISEIGIEFFPIIIRSSYTNEISKSYSESEFYEIILGQYSLKMAGAKTLFYRIN